MILCKNQAVLIIKNGKESPLKESQTTLFSFNYESPKILVSCKDTNNNAKRKVETRKLVT